MRHIERIKDCFDLSLPGTNAGGIQAAARFYCLVHITTMGFRITCRAVSSTLIDLMHGKCTEDSLVSLGTYGRVVKGNRTSQPGL
jgi:hypothetical protein